MDADYSVELGPSAPALEIPWQNPEGRLHFIDLRAVPGAIEHNLDRIPEAQLFPALRQFLSALNAPQSAWKTAKCDVWSGEAEAENLYSAGFSHGCYVDVVLAEQFVAARGSLEVHQRLAQEIARRLEADDALEATAEIVVRRCYFHLIHDDLVLEESVAGYCLTLFLTGYGASPVEAVDCWEGAMQFTAGCWLTLQPR